MQRVAFTDLTLTEPSGYALHLFNGSGGVSSDLTFSNITMDATNGQWLLVTLTAGVGGSLLSIGSAAGVALMGLVQGNYTFSHHLRWTWAIALGYAASIAAHLVINAAKF